MTDRRWITALVALALLVTGACNDATDNVPRENYGIVFAETRAVTEGYVLQPSATFFNSPQLTFNTSVVSADTCVIAVYDPNASDDLPGLRFLDVGDAITAEVDTAMRSLTKVAQEGVENYRVTTGGLMPFTPGDTMEIVAPGGTDFPAFTIKARTAETFTYTTPTPGAAGEALALSWSPRVQPGSTMLVSLRYASAGTTLDRQIYCDLDDDGAYTISAGTVADWRTSATRETVFTRWRTEVEQVNANTFVVVSSTLSVPTPGSGPTFSRTAGVFGAP